MCWITNKSEFAVKKIAEQDIPVFKIVRNSKSDGITAYFYIYKYTLGKQTEYKNMVEVRIKNSLCVIYTGFHSYDMKLKNLLKQSDGIAYIHSLDYDCCIRGYCISESVIMHCVIPAGTEYYENERGEIVSNMLKPISLENF